MKFGKLNLGTAKLVYTLILVLDLLSLTACSLQENKPLVTSPSSVDSRIVVDTSMPFHEKWRRGDLVLFNTEVDKIYVNGNRVFVLSYEDGGKTRKLEALNGSTGEVVWRTEHLPFIAHSLAMDGQTLYLALSSKIIAYEILSGKILWETQLPGDRTTYTTYTSGNILFVISEEDSSQNGDEKQVVRKYEVETGLLVEIDEFDIRIKNSDLLLSSSSYDYWSDGERLWAINPQIGQEQWKIEIDQKIRYQPILVDSKLVLATGIFSDVIGLENATGQQAWKYGQKIVSNLTANAGIIYVIRTDAAIAGIDSTTGKELGSISIEPAFTETSSRSHAYLITASNGMLYVYYGDSHELIAFQSDTNN